MYKILCSLILNITILLFSSILIADENKILFKINNEIVTSIDLLNEINYLKSINNDFKNLENNKKFEIAKQSIIREKVKEIELKKLLEEIKIENEILDSLIISYFKKFGINTNKEFNEYFISRKIDPNIVTNKITIEALWNQLVYTKFNKNVKIDEKTIKEELKKKSKQQEFLLSEIFFNLDNKEKLNDKFKKISNEIINKGFSQAALRYSIADSSKNGGKLGWIKESFLSKKIKSKIQLTKIGDFTKPIVVPGGFLILEIQDKRQTENEINIDKEIKIIIREKTNKQLNQFSNVYFNKIKKNIQIDEL